MSLVLPIEIPVDKAIPAIDAVVGGFGKVEDAAPRTAAAIAKAMTSSSVSIEKTKASAGSLATALAAVAANAEKMRTVAAAFGPLSAQLEREADIYARLHAPIRDYMADLQAVEQLKKKGLITAEQYANEEEDLYRNLAARSPGAVPHGGPASDPARALSTIGFGGHASGGGGESGEAENRLAGALGAIAKRGGEAGEALSQLATSGAVEAGVMVGVAALLVEVGNKYGELSNSVRRFTSSGVSADDVLHQQLDLADQLHARLDTTIELYRGVNEAAKPLLMTQKEQLDLTRNLGAIATENNKPFAAMAEVLQHLQYAAEGGAISGRELKEMMRQNADVAEIWTHALGKSRNEIVTLADDGKLNIASLVTAISSSKEPMAKMGEQTETLGQMWGHFKDRVDVSVGAWVSGVGQGVAAMQRAAGDFKAHPGEAISDIANSGDPFGFGKNIEALTGVKTQALGATDALAKAKAAEGEHAKAMHAAADEADRLEQQLAKNVRAVFSLDEYTTHLIATLHSADLKRITDEFAQLVTNISKPLAGPDALAGMNAILGPIAKAKHDLAELNSALRADPALNTDATSAQARSLREQITGAHDREYDIYASIKIAQRDYNTDLAATNDLYAHGAISIGEYARAREKLYAQKPPEDSSDRSRQVIDLTTAAQRAVGTVAYADRFGGPEMHADSVAGAYDTTQIDKGSAALKAYVDNLDGQARLLKEIRTPAERYQDDLERINATFADKSGPEYARLVQDLQDRYVSGVSPLADYNKELRNLADIEKIVTLLHEEHAAAVDKIRLAYLQAGAEGKTFAGGTERAVIELMGQITDVGTLTEKTLLDAFKGLEDGIIASANAGKLNFSSLIDSMLADLERLAARELELGFISLFTGGGVGKSAGGAIGSGLGGGVAAGLGVSARGASGAGFPGAPDSVSARGAPIVLQVHNHYDPHELLSAVDSREGNAAVLNVLRANPAAVQSYTGTARRGRGRGR